MKRHCKSWTALLVLMSFTGCSSFMGDMRSAMLGEESVAEPQVDRAPASTGNNRVEIDNRTGADYSVPAPGPRGPTLGNNDFAHFSSQQNAKSTQGFRSGANPWGGVGTANEGSLWRDDTQDNFYFARNVIYSVGDLFVVNIDTEINDALNLRIAQILGRTSVQQVVADEAGKTVGNEAEKQVQKVIGNDRVAEAVGRDLEQRTIASIDSKPRYVDVDNVTVRITELLNRGSYRIEGTKRVFVKDAPYNVKFSGIVRDEDIGANKMIASKSVLESKVELTK
ncbi:MAG TPA: flagellar basal body L-ring protein FlgH [Bdellovibrionota bacterium]|nr:flagellar basal body L-ring protein FlgH [Bdellovibrionota bacterium]